MKIKWNTGWKLNGVRCCDEIQEHVYFLDWLVMICLHLFINCLHYILGVHLKLFDKISAKFYSAT